MLAFVDDEIQAAGGQPSLRPAIARFTQAAYVRGLVIGHQLAAAEWPAAVIRADQRLDGLLERCGHVRYSTTQRYLHHKQDARAATSGVGGQRVAIEERKMP